MNDSRNLALAGIGCVLMLGVSVQSIAAGQQGTVTKNEAAVRRAGKAYVEALQRGDTNALVAQWTADGVYVDATGNFFNARELIRQQFGSKAVAETKTRETVDSSSSIRFVTSNVAIEEGASQTSSGADDESGRYTAIWVNEGDSWLLDSLRESASIPSSHGSRLDALAWMIGDWVGTGDSSTVKCFANWSENRQFIVRRFSVERAGDETLHGTQRIGWDPAAGRLRSWVFDSDGGVFEGRWRSEGDSWIVKTTGVLADGDRSTAINFWIPEGPDRFVLRTSHVKVGDVPVEGSVVEFKQASSSW